MDAKTHAQKLNKRAVKGHALDALELLDIHCGDTVVDIGAGGGIMTSAFSKLVGESGCVYAADIDEGLLAQIRSAKMEYDNVHTLYLENDHILLEHSYDLIFMRDVFHHLPNPVEFFEQLRPCLNQHGRVAIIDWNEHANVFLKLTGHYTPRQKILDMMAAAGYQCRDSYFHLRGQSFNIFSI